MEEAICLACDFLTDSPFADAIRTDLTNLPVRFWLKMEANDGWICI